MITAVLGQRIGFAFRPGYGSAPPAANLRLSRSNPRCPGNGTSPIFGARGSADTNSRAARAMAIEYGDMSARAAGIAPFLSGPRLATRGTVEKRHTPFLSCGICRLRRPLWLSHKTAIAIDGVRQQGFPGYSKMALHGLRARTSRAPRTTVPHHEACPCPCRSLPPPLPPSASVPPSS